jgi:hypothetical protein
MTCKGKLNLIELILVFSCPQVSILTEVIPYLGVIITNTTNTITSRSLLGRWRLVGEIDVNYSEVIFVLRCDGF